MLLICYYVPHFLFENDGKITKKRRKKNVKQRNFVEIKIKGNR